MFHSLSIKLSLPHLDASYHLEATPILRISDLTPIWREGKVNSMETKVKRGETHVMLATRMRTFSAPLLHNNKSAQISIWGWPTLIDLWERCCHCLVQSRSNWTVAGSWMSSARWKNKVLQLVEGKTCPYELSYLADWKFINFMTQHQNLIIFGIFFSFVDCEAEFSSSLNYSIGLSALLGSHFFDDTLPDRSDDSEDVIVVTEERVKEVEKPQWFTSKACFQIWVLCHEVDELSVGEIAEGHTARLRMQLGWSLNRILTTKWVALSKGTNSTQNVWSVGESSQRRDPVEASGIFH